MLRDELYGYICLNHSVDVLSVCGYPTWRIDKHSLQDKHNGLL